MTAYQFNGKYYDPALEQLGDGLSAGTAYGFAGGKWRTNIYRFFADFTAHIAGLVTSSINGSNIFGHEAPSSATSITLTNTSKRSQAITYTAPGQATKLPDATTITKGEIWRLRHLTNAAALQDNAGGVLLASLAVGDEVDAWCEANGTAAGTWRLNTRVANARTLLGSAVSAIALLVNVAADAAGLRAVALTPQSAALWGLKLANNGTDAANDIDIAAGECLDATGAKLLRLGSALTKRLDGGTWAVGTNQPGLDTGTETATALYYAWLIMRSDTGVVDVLFSLSATAPTMPANYDYKRLIGAFVNLSSTIRLFNQKGHTFWFLDAIADEISDGTITDEAWETGTLLIPAHAVAHILFTTVLSGAPIRGYVRPKGSSLSAASSAGAIAAGLGSGDNQFGATPMAVPLDANSQFEYAMNEDSGSGATITIKTYGFEMPQLACGG